MMVIGVDPHKQSHTAVAVDELGRKKAQKTVRARRDGHRELIAWARQACPDGRAWAVEDVRHVAGGLVRELLAAGEAVVFVPPKLMAGARSGGRERGKSDPIDALAIARAALREEITLPAARLDGPVPEVRRLGDYRDDLVAERTRVVNTLRWLVHDLDPALAPPPRSLGSARARALAQRQPRDRQRVNRVGLAPLPPAAPLPGHQLRRHEHDLLPGRQQLPDQPAGHVPHVLHRPQPPRRGDLAGPGDQLPVPLPPCPHRALGLLAAQLIGRDRGVRLLVRVNPDYHHQCLQIPDRRGGTRVPARRAYLS